MDEQMVDEQLARDILDMHRPVPWKLVAWFTRTHRWCRECGEAWPCPAHAAAQDRISPHHGLPDEWRAGR
jgi:hypothetical protein